MQAPTSDAQNMYVKMKELGPLGCVRWIRQ